MLLINHYLRSSIQVSLMTAKKTIALYLLLIFSLISARGNAQSAIIGKIFRDTVMDCREIQYACMQMIPLYYTDRQFDTAYALVDFWKRKCGMDETIFRTQVLFDIDKGSFSDSILLKYDFIRFLDIYSILAHDTGTNFIYYYPDYYVEEPELLLWYKMFTDTLARRCIRYPDLSPSEKFFTSYYTHPTDSLYLMIKGQEYTGSILEKRVNRPVHGDIPDVQFHYSLQAGIWIPDKNLKILGNHPSIGGQAGFRYGKYSGDLSLDFRFLRSPDDYQVKLDDSVTMTHRFSNLSFRLDAGYQIQQWRNTELIFTSGIGVEQLSAIYEMNDILNDEDDVTRDIYSLNINLGGSWRIYLRNNHYLAVTGRYHFLKFSNPGGTKLNGNALTLSMEYGLGMNQWLNERNTILRLKTRKYLR